MFTGSIVAIVTPMQAGVAPDTSLDYIALERLVELHIEQGTKGIVAVGTTGESATLTEEEHCAVIEKMVKLVKGRIPVIAGTGANSTIEAISLTKCAKEAGADACLLVTPYYNKPTQEGLFQHYKVIRSKDFSKIEKKHFLDRQKSEKKYFNNFLKKHSEIKNLRIKSKYFI